jgi:hypothetical protein
MIIKGRGFRKLSKHFTQNIEMSRRKLCTIHKKFVQNSDSSHVCVAHASICGVYHPCLAPPGWEED